MKYQLFVGRCGRSFIRRGIQPEEFNPYFREEDQSTDLEWDSEGTCLKPENGHNLKRLHHEIDKGIEGEPKPIKSQQFAHEELNYYFFEKMSNENNEVFDEEQFKKDIKKRFD